MLYTPRNAAAMAVITVGLMAVGGCQGPAGEPSAQPTGPAAGIDATVALEDQLLAAIQDGDAAAVTRLVDSGASVSEDLGAGNQALHVAALASRADLVPILIAAGAEVDARAHGDSTPLMLAADRADAATVRALLDAGADPYLADSQGYETTAIHRAAREGNVAALEELVGAGVDVNLLEGTQAHALMYAAFNGELEAVEYLVAAGSDLEIRDDAGKTAYEWAIERGNDEVAAALAAAGADIDGP